MSPSVPELDIELPEVSQVGIVVEDLEDGMDRYGSVLDLGPWKVHEVVPPRHHETTYRGRDHEFGIHIAIAETSETDIELIEPVEGESVHTEFLAEHGEGIHHLACFAYDDPHAVVDRFVDGGIPVVQSGAFGDLTYWYFETEDILNGMVFEIAANLDGMPEPDRVYPD